MATLTAVGAGAILASVAAAAVFAPGPGGRATLTTQGAMVAGGSVRPVAVGTAGLAGGAALSGSGGRHLPAQGAASMIAATQVVGTTVVPADALSLIASASLTQATGGVIAAAVGGANLTALGSCQVMAFGGQATTGDAELTAVLSALGISDAVVDGQALAAAASIAQAVGTQIAGAFAGADLAGLATLTGSGASLRGSAGLIATVLAAGSDVVPRSLGADLVAVGLMVAFAADPPVQSETVSTMRVDGDIYAVGFSARTIYMAATLLAAVEATAQGLSLVGTTAALSAFGEVEVAGWSYQTTQGTVELLGDLLCEGRSAATETATTDLGAGGDLVAAAYQAGEARGASDLLGAVIVGGRDIPRVFGVADCSSSGQLQCFLGTVQSYDVPMHAEIIGSLVAGGTQGAIVAGEAALSASGGCGATGSGTARAGYANLLGRGEVRPQGVHQRPLGSLYAFAGLTLAAAASDATRTDHFAGSGALVLDQVVVEEAPAGGRAMLAAMGQAFTSGREAHVSVRLSMDARGGLSLEGELTAELALGRAALPGYGWCWATGTAQPAPAVVQASLGGAAMVACMGMRSDAGAEIRLDGRADWALALLAIEPAQGFIGVAGLHGSAAALARLRSTTHGGLALDGAAGWTCAGEQVQVRGSEVRMPGTAGLVGAARTTPQVDVRLTGQGLLSLQGVAQDVPQGAGGLLGVGGLALALMWLDFEHLDGFLRATGRMEVVMASGDQIGFGEIVMAGSANLSMDTALGSGELGGLGGLALDGQVAASARLVLPGVAGCSAYVPRVHMQGLAAAGGWLTQAFVGVWALAGRASAVAVAAAVDGCRHLRKAMRPKRTILVQCQGRATTQSPLEQMTLIVTSAQWQVQQAQASASASVSVAEATRRVAVLGAPEDAVAVDGDCRTVVAAPQSGQVAVLSPMNQVSAVTPAGHVAAHASGQCPAEIEESP